MYSSPLACSYWQLVRLWFCKAQLLTLGKPFWVTEGARGLRS